MQFAYQTSLGIKEAILILLEKVNGHLDKANTCLCTFYVFLLCF